MKRFSLLVLVAVLLATLAPLSFREHGLTVSQADASASCTVTVYRPLYVYNNQVDYGGKASCVAGPPAYRIQAWLYFNGSAVDWTDWQQFTTFREVRRQPQVCSTRGPGNYFTHLEVWRWSSTYGWINTDSVNSIVTRPCG